MKNRNNIMTFKKFISYFKLTESLKEARLNQILDKISKKVTLSKTEQDFLDNYDQTSEDDMMDYRMLSKESTFTKISNLLEDGKKVICNLVDRDGKIGIQIVKIYNRFDDETCIMTLKNGEKVKFYFKYAFVHASFMFLERPRAFSEMTMNFIWKDNIEGYEHANPIGGGGIDAIIELTPK